MMLDDDTCTSIVDFPCTKGNPNIIDNCLWPCYVMPTLMIKSLTYYMGSVEPHTGILNWMMLYNKTCFKYIHNIGLEYEYL